ncbi:GNAT family N-acetyltransferase [Oceanicaulis sp. MMSF_3324]|uniref:GNAT family N-acetyltransferase n=1 Tax=Oceanicaulis sp. MMSF_3324 TaxID=3046702 RepID=UPI00273E6332|nr:GNAT family N-acetyltransferase [Oceanicaulis sp. MMSF_3324]
MRLFDTPLSALGVRDLDLWRDLARPLGRLTSPYLLPEFAQMVDDQRHDVRVIIAEENSAPVGYFAYHAPQGGIARPVGAPLSDYQGFAARPGFKVDETALLKVMGADVLVYDNWMGASLGKTRAQTRSSVIDLSEGFDAWMAHKEESQRKHFKKLRQRHRKAEREFGPVRVVFGDPLGDRFDKLRTWKSRQYQETGLLDLFDVSWIDGVIRNCAARSFGPFRGLVASLYLGDELAAVEMGMVAGDIYHSWIPAYDPRFSAVSPGLLLLQGLLEAAPGMGVTRIDLGGGDLPYKAAYADYEVTLNGGRAMTPSLAMAGLLAWDSAEAAARLLPGPLSKAPLKLRRRWAQTAAAEPVLSRRVRRMGEAFLKAPQRLTA